MSEQSRTECTEPFRPAGDLVDRADHRGGREREMLVSAGRQLRTTPVFETYWRFAAERQHLFMRRATAMPPPWTDDPVLTAHRFTNVYRAADRVSQYLIRHVIYDESRATEDTFFRVLLFKIFNRIGTWEAIVAALGEPCWRRFDFERYARVLDSILARAGRIYSAAYIMPSPGFGSPRKHRNHLRLLEYMMRDGAARRSARAKSLQELFQILRGYPSLGDFLSFQFAIDLNYSELNDFSEMEFVVAGPGARSGIRKCFSDTAGLCESDIIRMMADRADVEFARLGLTFQTLWGRRLQLIDCQNLFCEVDKYARVVHPEFTRESGRTRIKQRFTPSPKPVVQWYPPKWGLHIPAAVRAESTRVGGTARRERHKSASVSASPR